GGADRRPAREIVDHANHVRAAGRACLAVSPPPARHRPGARSARRGRCRGHPIADRPPLRRRIMWLPSVLSVWRLAAHLTPSGRRHGCRRPPPTRLSFAALEERCVPTTTPNAPIYPSQYNYAARITHANDAWDLTTGSSKVVVADIDTGIDYTHPDL